jgi:4-hydroxybenzoate polyprenyltransferase
MVAIGSSSTWPRTSTRSSTSDGRIGGLVRLTHPFPSLLDGAVVGAVALTAGADSGTAARLVLSMVVLQASIGALNDLVDAPRDAGHKPGKPIPAGAVAPAAAATIVLLSGGLGVLLAIPSGMPLVVLALAGLAIGYGYDLRFKGTAWSWLPFAVGIPLLPVYGWLGATGVLPPFFAILVPMTVLAGSALAIANALADLERDRAAGTDSVAIHLGRDRSWALNAALLGTVMVVAVGSLIIAETPRGALIGALAGCALVTLGLAVGRLGNDRRPDVAWEIQAVGLGVMATAWIAGVAPAA